MPPNKIPEGRSKIDLIIDTANQLRKIIQIQDADEVPGERPMLSATQSTSGLKSATQSTSGLKGKVTGEAGLERSKSEPSPTTLTDGTRIEKLKDALLRLRRNLKHMKTLQLDVEKEIDNQISELMTMSKDTQTSEMEKQLDLPAPVDEEGVKSTEMKKRGAKVQRVDEGEQLRKILTNWNQSGLDDITEKLLVLISKVPAKRKKKKASTDYLEGHGDDKGRRLLCLPAIHANEEDLKSLEVFGQVIDEFKKLSTYRQICLLSFAVFPENQEVNRTMLMYWWIGEDILPDSIKPEESNLPDEVKPKRGSSSEKGKPEKDRREDVVKDILEDFVNRKLIEPVANKRKVKPNSYKMTPFVHSSVVLISKKIGLFDMYHEDEKKPTMNQSKLNKVCLVEGSSSQKEARSKLKDADHIETVFNVSEGFPDFTSKSFSSMKKLKVLYLGRWERTEREVRVESRKVMKNLSSMKKLRFLSFQGISTIKTLSRAVCKLKELIILDLRGCDYLDKLPEDIHKLENLVYLDLTGCDAFENIPMGLADLSNLEVLKGFVVCDDREIGCKLNDLKKLEKLRKLSISIDREVFGLDVLIKEINVFKALENLKVRWGSRIPLSKKVETKSREAGAPVTPLPKQLKKLDLQRFPDSELPDWLQPQNLNHLEKLYLGSWKHLNGFGAFPVLPNKTVKVLRLRCMPNLKVEWRDLTQVYFSEINFVESFECPRVTFSPCDRNGIWRSEENDDSTTTL